MKTKNITALIKPASGNCNLHCRYCFYRDVSNYRHEQSTKQLVQTKNHQPCECSKPANHQKTSETEGAMTSSTAKSLIEKCLTYSNGGDVTFCFQGGEPLLAGYDFFEQFVLYVNELNTSGCQVHYSLQTNGVLIDERFCAFFHEHEFLIGVSLDGLPEIHDELRCTKEHNHQEHCEDHVGKHNVEMQAKKSDHVNPGSYDQVTDSIKLLEKYAIPFNILIVVTPQLAKKFEDVWYLLRKKKYDYLQFINCLAPFGDKQQEWSYSLLNEEFANFQCRLFDAYWKENRQGGFVSFRHLDNLLYMLHGYKAEQCTIQGFCAGQLVVEADGSVYPCDFYCTDRYLMGNINDNTLEELSASPAMKRFTSESRIVAGECQACEVRGICRGGCRREREFLGDGQLSLNKYCKGLKQFYAHVLATCKLK